MSQKLLVSFIYLSAFVGLISGIAITLIVIYLGGDPLVLCN